MKFFIIFFLYFIFLFSIQGEEFDKKFLKNLIEDRSALILDVRPLADYLNLHIPNAKRLECSELTGKQDVLLKWVKGDRSRPIIVYAQTKERAESAKQILEKQGFQKIINLGLQSFWYQ